MATRAGLSWAQEDPGYLHFTPLGEAPRTIARGSPVVGPAAARLTRIPDGCPEGFLEGFANLYGDAAELIWARIEGREPDPDAALLPTVQDGLAGHAVHRGGAAVGPEQRRLDQARRHDERRSEQAVVSESSQAKAGPRRKLRLGMVGGGQGAFIGGVHRIAARLDGRYELVAGAFSSTAEKSKASGAELGLDGRSAATAISTRWPSARSGARTGSTWWRSSRPTTSTSRRPRRSSTAASTSSATSR